MPVERETPFSMTEGEYRAFTERETGFTNSCKDSEPLFVSMRDDLPRFAKTETCRILLAALDRKG
jgi:hypothetical protein